MNQRRDTPLYYLFSPARLNTFLTYNFLNILAVFNRKICTSNPSLFLNRKLDSSLVAGEGEEGKGDGTEGTAGGGGGGGGEKD